MILHDSLMSDASSHNMLFGIEFLYIDGTEGEWPEIRSTRC